MKRTLGLGRGWACALLVGWLAGQAAADPPDILRHYRFIPSHSTVHVTGGFAGFDWNLAIAGRFGLVTGYGQDVDGPIPTLPPYAQFVDVHAILFNSIPSAWCRCPCPVTRNVCLEKTTISTRQRLPVPVRIANGPKNQNHVEQCN